MNKNKTLRVSALCILAMIVFPAVFGFVGTFFDYSFRSGAKTGLIVVVIMMIVAIVIGALGKERGDYN